MLKQETKITPKEMKGENRRCRLCFAAMFLSVLFLFGCKQNEIYFKYHHLADALWHKSEHLSFDIDSIQALPGKHYSLSFELTHNKQYPYQNLWLIVSNNFPLNASTDTLEISLCDDNGHWLGKGVGGMHQLSIPYKKNVSTDSLLNSCRVSIRHYMRDEPLKGIERVGLRLVEQ